MMCARACSTQVNWHDFAFFDPVMYESLRQLIRHSQASEAEAVFAAMDLAFAIDLCKEEGSGQVTPFCSEALCHVKYHFFTYIPKSGCSVTLAVPVLAL